MNTNWWRSQSELDDAQKQFILLPPEGRHILEGPPGSGKTNLLLLRAQYFAGRGEKNVLIITFTKSLTDFVRSGIAKSKLIQPSQVRTYHSWATEHVLQFLGPNALPDGDEFDDAMRVQLLEAVQRANKKLPSAKLYSAVFVDEAQDLSGEELKPLLSLSDRICVCGDARQGIYNKDGLDALASMGFKKHVLANHFRIGQRIARVADRLLPQQAGYPSLEDTANYNPKVQGDSSAKMIVCASRDEQFETMLALMRIQLDAFKGDSIGVFCGTKEARKELWERFRASDLAGRVSVHGEDKGATFSSDTPIHVLTIHSAKGTEFRAVHIYGAEEMRKFPLNRRTLGFTAVTRAKTALRVYRSGDTNAPLEHAFAEPALFGLDDLLPGDLS